MKKLILLMSLVSIITSCGKSQSSGESTVEVKKSALVAETAKLWENGKTLNVVFMDGTDEQKIQVANYANEWMNYANLTFKYYNSEKALQRGDKAHITITFKAKGNHSSVGTDSAYKHYGHSMSLSALSKDNFVNRYYIIHEFGHAIGLHHEHQNINRTFDFNEEKALEYCKKSYSWDKASCRLNIISFKKGKGYYSSKYDPKSIMHYSLHKDMTSNKVELATSYNFSLLDKLEVAKLYPGRISAETIIAQHKDNIAMADEYKRYKNCKLTETFVESIRLNEDSKAELIKVPFYGFESLTPGDFTYKTTFEDKEIAVAEMTGNEYCHYKTDELRNYRSTLADKRLSGNKFGNCEIPLDENGLPIAKNCYDSAPFRIMKAGKEEMAINACYHSFDAAKAALKTVEYCSLSSEEIQKTEAAEAAKLKQDMKLGKCFVLNKKDLVKPKGRVCPEITPWFVTNDTKVNILGSCYEYSTGAISDMKKAKECQP